MILYLTFNDALSGIFRSQVIDVIRFMESELKANIRLVAFISLRGFSESKKQILALAPTAIVVPMFPTMRLWKLNRYTLQIIVARLKPSKIICRSVFATNLALKAIKNQNISIVYDGRGAISAEVEEYNVIKDTKIKMKIHALEKNAIIQSDFRIAVSDELLKYWKSRFKYVSERHVIIPCTLDNQFTERIVFNTEFKRRLGFDQKDVILIYSGSTAGWQSFELMYHFFSAILKQENLKIIFLSSRSPLIENLERDFPGKVLTMKVPFEEVRNYLSIGDYGILIREDSVTNKVASPVKFAEYLAAGLKVIISPSICDYSAFVKENHCGYWVSDLPNTLPMLTSGDREHAQDLSKYFYKQHYTKAYTKVLES